MTPGDERKSSAAGGDARLYGSWPYPHVIYRRIAAPD
jgi:hypothetical protein